MKINLISPSLLEKPMRVAVHKTGKIGFPDDVTSRLKLSNEKSIGLGFSDDPNDKSLYMIVFDTVRGDAFRILKAGRYYYLNTALLFDSLKIDYKRYSLSYELEQYQEGASIYKLKAKVKDREPEDDEME